MNSRVEQVSSDLCGMIWKRSAYLAVYEALEEDVAPDVQQKVLLMLMEKFPDRALDGPSPWLQLLVRLEHWRDTLLNYVACKWCPHTLCKVIADMPNAASICEQIDWSGLQCDYPPPIRQALKKLILGLKSLSFPNQKRVLSWIASDLTGTDFWQCIGLLFQFHPAPWILTLARFALDPKRYQPNVTPCATRIREFSLQPLEGQSCLESRHCYKNGPNFELFELLVNWCTSQLDETFTFSAHLTIPRSYLEVLFRTPSVQVELYVQFDTIVPDEWVPLIKRVAEIAAVCNVSISLPARVAEEIHYPKVDGTASASVIWGEWEHHMCTTTNSARRKLQWVSTLAEALFIPPLATAVAEYCLLDWERVVVIK